VLNLSLAPGSGLYFVFAIAIQQLRNPHGLLLNRAAGWLHADPHRRSLLALAVAVQHAGTADSLAHVLRQHPDDGRVDLHRHGALPSDQQQALHVQRCEGRPAGVAGAASRQWFHVRIPSRHRRGRTTFRL
uniref:Uncharacterized protein n=1 Tax=Anopheles dirus TaxID=7168 RepID=A0A182NX66_9DIPT